MEWESDRTGINQKCLRGERCTQWTIREKESSNPLSLPKTRFVKWVPGYLPVSILSLGLRPESGGPSRERGGGVREFDVTQSPCPCLKPDFCSSATVVTLLFFGLISVKD